MWAGAFPDFAAFPLPFRAKSLAKKCFYCLQAGVRGNMSQLIFPRARFGSLYNAQGDVEDVFRRDALHMQYFSLRQARELWRTISRQN